MKRIQPITHHITHHYCFLPYKLPCLHAMLRDTWKVVYSPLKPSIQLKSIPPSCSKGRIKKVVPSGTSLDGQAHPKLVPAQRLEIFSLLACQCLEVYCPVSPVTSVCTISPSG